MLEENLESLGFEFRPAGGGLALHRIEDGERLCKASELGFSYSRLIERFGEGLPGHAHTWIAERVLKDTEEAEDVLEWD